MRTHRGWKIGLLAMAACASPILWPSSASAVLVYRQNFDDANGIPEVTPGAGVLGVDPATGNGDAVFNATNGIFGGVLNLSSATAIDPAAIAATSGPAGLLGSPTDITGIGTLNGVTVTMWVNVQTFRTDIRSRFTNVLVLGDAPANFQGANSIGIALGSNKTTATTGNPATTGPRELNVYLKSSTSAPLDFEANPSGIDGSAVTPGEWVFLAVSYDGTSTRGNNSDIQSAATGGLSSLNGQIYKGSATSSVTRFEAPFTNPVPSGINAALAPGNPSAGPINFSLATRLMLGNSTSINRGLDGFIDDVQIFDNVLSASDIETIRQLGLQGLSIAGLSVPHLVVNRQTGAVTIQSPVSAAAVDFTGYSIGSAFGGLNATNWKPISGNYDSAGNGSVDDGAWSVQGSDFLGVSEMTFDAGATLSPGQSIPISQGSGLWIPTYAEDLAVQLNLVGGGTLALPVVYTQNNNKPLPRSDFNGDGALNATDYTAIFLPNFLKPGLSGASPALLYRQGDLDGDSDVDIDDFAIFRHDYDTAHGAGAFQAMAAGVPEPSTLALVAIGLFSTIALRRRSSGRTQARNPAAVRIAAFGIALFAALPAQANTLGWWRLGDDDPSPVNGATISTSLIHAGTYGDMNNGTALPFYSTLVPGHTILDPLANQKLVNNWSLSTSATVDKQHRFTPSAIVPSAGFSIETFVRFQNVAAATGVDFAYQLTNVDGGWAMELDANGNVHAYMSSRIGDLGSGGGTVVLNLNSTTPLTSGKWHHVALVFQGNSLNASNDAHLFVDYALEASGNMDDATFFGGNFFNVMTGEVFGTTAMNTDEVRLLDTPLALDGSQFLRVAGVRTTINTMTGEIRLINDSLQTFNVSSYQINSSFGRLLTDNAHWHSLHDQNLNPVSGGNDPGETWDESPNVSSTTIAETFLLGGTVLAPGGSLSLGTAYDLGTGDPFIDSTLTSSLFDVTSGSVINTTVKFVANIPGDFNGDGKVDAADYVLWRKNPNGFLPATYETWRQNFGAGSGSGSSLGDAGAVPEPTACVLLAVAIAGAFAPRRPRQ